MLQGQKCGVQSTEATDLTVWIISYISLYDYVISLDLIFLPAYKFGCKNIGEGRVMNLILNIYFKNYAFHQTSYFRTKYCCLNFQEIGHEVKVKVDSRTRSRSGLRSRYLHLRKEVG